MEVLSVNQQFSNQLIFGASVKGDWSATSYITHPKAHLADPEGNACDALSLRLQQELRAAKSKHLSCTEVLLPFDLLPRVAKQMLTMSEHEPCGIRGCSVFIQYENEDGVRTIASLKGDPSTVSTFELFLTLKQDKNSWTSMLPQFLKNLARGGTVMISPEFTLSKNKLYRSYQNQE